MGERIIEGTITLVILFLILTNAAGFSQVASALSAAYIGGVQQLQGGPRAAAA